MKNKIWYSRKENPMRFWLQLTLLSAILWLVFGLAGFLKPTGTAETILNLLVGLCPCGVLLFAVLALMAHKWDTPPLDDKAQRIEDVILGLFGVLTALAQLVYPHTGDINYSVPMVICALASVAIIRISAPAISKKELKKRNGLQSKLESADIVKVIILGSFIAVIFAMFFRSASGVLMGLGE